MAVVEGQESIGVCEVERTAHDDIGEAKTAQGISLIALTLEQVSQGTATSRFPRVGPTFQNPDGEAIPEQRTLLAGPVEQPLEESPEIAAD